MKTLLFFTLLVLHNCAFGELSIILKVRRDIAQSIEIKRKASSILTDIADWDELNARYCCSDITRVYEKARDSSRAKMLGMDRVYKLTLNCNDEESSTVINDFVKTACFEYVEPNHRMAPSSAKAEPFYPNDHLFFNNLQWAWHNTNERSYPKSRIDVDIDMPEAWGIERGDSSVIIAILDSGIKNFKGEFDNRIWINTKDVFDRVDNDNNGYVDDFRGYNFVSGDGKSILDVNGHGTTVASIIGANINNREGLAGMNGHSKLMILKITEDYGRSDVDDMAEAIIYAADNGARVINISHGNPIGAMTVQDAINYAYSKNVTICAASGNDNVNQVYFPARFANVIAVGATGPFDTRCVSWLGAGTGGSNYGDSLDVTAPGDYIHIVETFNDHRSYRAGTSLATAFVSGLASLLVSQNPSITNDALFEIITSTAEDQVGDPSEDTPGYDTFYGYGRINAYQALLRGEELKTGKPLNVQTHRNRAATVRYSKVSNQLLVRFEAATHKGSSVKLSVTDVAGRLLYSVPLMPNKACINVMIPSLSKGLYLYSLDYGDKLLSGKFMN